MRIVSYLIVFIVILSFNAYGEVFYRVQKGDSLYKISKRFNVSIEELRSANNLSKDKLKPGQRLNIPSRHNTVSLVDKTHDASEVQTASRSSADFYIVKKGDTLSSISKKYNIPISDLKEINELKSNKLRIGQKIFLKKTGPRTYTVKKGDNIWKIAKRFGIGVEELMELNELDSEELRPGQMLVVEVWIDEKETLENSGESLKRYEALISEPGSGDSELGVKGSPETPIPIKDRIILFAKKMLNIPYRFGGSSLMGIDCSGYVQKVFGYLNIPLPRTAREQFEIGESVNREELSIGDLVFFRTYASFPSHVGIYLGNNLFIHASSKSKKVTIDSLDTPYYFKRFIGAKRIIDTEEMSKGE